MDKRWCGMLKRGLFFAADCLPVNLHAFSRILSLLCLSTAAAVAAQADSALTALKALPADAAKNLARIEAREGKPSPERWHILVHDTASQNGLREYVVAKGQVVASREISQFAETLTAADVISDEGLKTDSDKAAKAVQEYAAANKMKIGALSYQLRKEGAEAKPVWQVKCSTEAGEPLGSLVVDAADGTVMSSEGFATEPGKRSGKKRDKKLEPIAETTQKKEEMQEVASATASGESTTATDNQERPKPKTRSRSAEGADEKPKKKARTAERRDPARRAQPVVADASVEVRRAEPIDEPAEEPPPRRSLLQRARGLLPF